MNEEKKLNDAAREARNRYYREYRAKNRDRIKAIRQRYWERRAEKEQETKSYEQTGE